MTSREPVRIAALPQPLRWLAEPVAWSARGENELTLAAGPRTDRFADPQRTREPTLNAPALVCTVDGDFRLSAQVSVDFAATYDAGVLIVHASDSVWAKLCFEYSPQREPMVVSVVTNEVSDDCNSFVVDGDSVWLRVARTGRALAFHASRDGRRWEFVRHFALAAGEPLVGFAAQSPTGHGCGVRFERIAYEPAGLGNLRNGE